MVLQVFKVTNFGKLKVYDINVINFGVIFKY